MNVLIVDDQYDNKVKSITRKIKSLTETNVKHVLTARDAYDAMTASSFDLLILDLQIPESLGEDVDVDGGINFLEMISSDEEIDIPSIIVGVTSHKESYDNNIQKFTTKGWTLHLFDGETDFIEEIIETTHRRSKPDHIYDVAFITALRHTEFEALLNNGMKWIELDFNDCNKYYTTTFADKSNIQRTAIATYCQGMGMPISAAVSMKIINKFSPKLVIMTGIAAGVEGKVNLGDVIVPSQIWDWGSGKLTDTEHGTTHLFDPESLSVDVNLINEIKEISSKGLYVDEIKRNYQGATPANSLAIHVGPVASGASVLADSKTIELIKEQKRSVIGVEMEAYGVLVACRLCGQHPTKALIIKSACDFANAHKNDDWQKYAAYTSTMIAKNIIERHIDFNK